MRIFAGTFCSMIFTVQYRPAELSALADARGRSLPRLSVSPKIPAALAVRCALGQRLLEVLHILWQLTDLLAEYPDALLVQTHRDPLVVTELDE